MQISFVIPSRNNLKYFKWAYDSIRRNQGNHEVYICAADDASTDGTDEYFKKLKEVDPFFDYITNPGPDRVGHTILYDRIINELVKTEAAMIFHADMYLCPMALQAIENDLFRLVYHDHIDGGFELMPNYGTIVSLTRIEPPLHPPGPEKIIKDFGIEPEDFKEAEFLEWFKRIPPQYETKVTHGIFAPWAFFVKDFNSVYGHDPLFKPQSKEDSDIFNKFALKGVNFIQTWTGFVYHMTCRGSRFNPSLTTVGKNSGEWIAHNIKSARNFIRKWGTYVSHDELMKPIVKPKYNISCQLKSATLQDIEAVEPWVRRLLVSNPGALDYGKIYISKEQPNTLYDLTEKIFQIPEDNNRMLMTSDVHVVIEKGYRPDINMFMLLPDILEKHEGGQGMFELVAGMMVYINKFPIPNIIEENLLEHTNIDGTRHIYI